MEELLLLSSEKRARLREWYVGRDTFLGINCRKQDFAKGLAMIRTCQDVHEDAKWLCSTDQMYRI